MVGCFQQSMRWMYTVTSETFPVSTVLCNVISLRSKNYFCQDGFSAKKCRKKRFYHYCCLSDCLVTLSGATKLFLGLSISTVMTFSCKILLVLPEVTATNFSKDPLAACDQISSVKESSMPGISYQTMYISTPLLHLKEVCQMLISLLLLNATKSKLYVHLVELLAA